VAGQWFSPGTSISSTNKTDCREIFNFHDTCVLTKIKFQQIYRYVRITLSELIDQQFKIGNVLE
jgi:hypothetical protein